ncbi:hypothetical protein GLOIN_2v1885398 [Rhizophagus irregularis DAOM 181602=DAOM 197198]|nr:hypothetical protein GLOIN_2v1885398 [Rhizophagus irregularis DAOM 181602=DAOM 197198]CAG8742049.1 8488_t:CDS:2 [Rhizophagus irregularis]
MYGNLHITYKKTLQKALQKKFQSLQLIEILENFTNEDSSKNKVESNNESKEELGDVNDRSNEKEGSSKTKQWHCKKCGQLGYYQKNCNA